MMNGCSNIRRERCAKTGSTLIHPAQIQAKKKPSRFTTDDAIHDNAPPLRIGRTKVRTSTRAEF